MERLYTISEVAEKLGIAAKTLRRWEDTGKFVGVRTLGGQRRYSLTDIQILDAIKHGSIPNSADLLTIGQAAKLFSVSPTTIARWEEAGKIHPLITAGVTYYPQHRLLAKMEELKKQALYDADDFEPVVISAPIPPQTKVSPDRTVEERVYRELGFHEPPASAPYPAPPPVDPTLPRLRRPLTPLIAPPPVPGITRAIVINGLVTMIMIVVYHLFFNSPRIAPVSPVSQGSVQGVTAARNSLLVTLDSILDKKGNLRPMSLSTGSLSLTPASAPENATPGSIYFDTGSQSLKLFTTGWTDLSGLSKTALQGTIVVSGHDLIPKNSNSLKIASPEILENSQISVTFTADYSPAKKYWLTKTVGSFTLYLDYPVSTNSSFDYLIINPATIPVAETETPASSPSTALVNPVIR